MSTLKQHLDPCNSPCRTGIPEPARGRLAAEGVHDLQHWRALGRRRLQIFGITRSMAAQLDALARGAL